MDDPSTNNEGKLAAKPGQIESCIDPTNQVIVRHRIFEV
jgi:hypothetical protein